MTDIQIKELFKKYESIDGNEPEYFPVRKQPVANRCSRTGAIKVDPWFLPFAIRAAKTIGLDLVPVVPLSLPTPKLYFFDYSYGRRCARTGKYNVC